MDRLCHLIPDVTIEILAKSFFRNSLHYGFRKLDYLRFINYLLDLMINATTKFDGCEAIDFTTNCSKYTNRAGQLPIDGHEVTFTRLGYQISLAELDQLIPEGTKRYTLHSSIAINTTSNINSDKVDHTKIATLITHHNKSISVIAYVDYDPNHQTAELVVYLDEKDEEKKAMKRDAIMHHVMACLRHQGIWFSENLYRYLNRKIPDD